MFHGEWIKEKRLKKGISRRELAEAAGMSVRTLEKWENGSEPRNLLYLNNIATALDCSIQDFCDIKLYLKKEDLPQYQNNEENCEQNQEAPLYTRDQS